MPLPMFPRNTEASNTNWLGNKVELPTFRLAMLHGRKLPWNTNVR
jgi:hypothetical protein